MKIYPVIKKTIAPIYNRSPKLKDTLLLADTYVDCLRHTVAEKVPRIIRPDPR